MLEVKDRLDLSRFGAGQIATIRFNECNPYKREVLLLDRLEALEKKLEWMESIIKNAKAVKEEDMAVMIDKPEVTHTGGEHTGKMTRAQILAKARAARKSKNA
jgi:hypothetical protein